MNADGMRYRAIESHGYQILLNAGHGYTLNLDGHPIAIGGSVSSDRDAMERNWDVALSYAEGHLREIQIAESRKEIAEQYGMRR